MIILSDFINTEAGPLLLVGRLCGEMSSGAGSKLHNLCLDWISSKPEMFSFSWAMLIAFYCYLSWLGNSDTRIVIQALPGLAIGTVLSFFCSGQMMSPADHSG